MCYSAESSFSSFVIGTISSLILLTFNNKYIQHAGVFFICVCLMQLLEYFMWIDQDCVFANDMATRFVVPVLALQVFALYFGGLYFNTINIPYLYHPIAMASIVIISLYFISKTTFSKKKLCSRPKKNQDLKWDYGGVDMSIALFVYFFMFNLLFLLLGLKSEIWVFTYIFGLYYYVLNNGSHSYWCYYSAGIPLFLVILSMLDFKGK